MAFTTLGKLHLKKMMVVKKISVNPLHLLIDHVSGYIEGKGVNKYLVFDSTVKNKKLLKKYNDIWNGIKNKINEISDNERDYEKIT